MKKSINKFKVMIIVGTPTVYKQYRTIPDGIYSKCLPSNNYLDDAVFSEPNNHKIYLKHELNYEVTEEPMPLKIEKKLKFKFSQPVQLTFNP